MAGGRRPHGRGGSKRRSAKGRPPKRRSDEPNSHLRGKKRKRTQDAEQYALVKEQRGKFKKTPERRETYPVPQDTEEELSDSDPSAYDVLVSSVGYGVAQPSSDEDEFKQQRGSDKAEENCQSDDRGIVKVESSDEEVENLENEGTAEAATIDEGELSSDEQEQTENAQDHFVHFEEDLNEELVEQLGKQDKWSSELKKWPVLGNIVYKSISNKFPSDKFIREGVSAANLALKEQLFNNLKTVNQTCFDEKRTRNPLLSPLQESVYQLLQEYKDLYYPERSYVNGEELRFVYCLHAVNHILKTRSKVVHHNSKLSRRDEVPDEYRDQGLTRPKVLIIVPFKESALRIVKIIMGLLSSDEKKINVINKKRFQAQYGSDNDPSVKARQRPADYEATFIGNVDDMFRIGLTVTRKSLKLYADFYVADIIIASPLGLRTVIGVSGEPDYDYDFLSSIEVLVMDQAEIFMMQNWEHILHVFSHLHMQPREAHEVDFSRVRMWMLSGLAKYYRQTVILSSVSHPVINAVFNKHCTNYAGKARVSNPIERGSICQLVAQLPQVFQIFSAANCTQLPNARFQFFCSKILPQFKDAVMSHALIFIPSYFDYVRVRNHFKKEELRFVQICEYSKDAKVARARDYFFHGKRQFLIYTERAHFFHRYVIKGVRHIIFYELPVNPHFYSEMCNMLQDSQRKMGGDGNLTCTVLYASQDAQQLAAVVGTHRASIMLNSDRKAHMFVTGDT